MISSTSQELKRHSLCYFSNCRQNPGFEKVLLSLKWRDGSPCVGKHEKGNCFWRCVMRSQTFYIPRVSETFIALRFQVEIHVPCIFSRPLTVAESLGRATIMLILKTLERNVKA